MLNCQFESGVAHLRDFAVVPPSDTSKKKNRAATMALRDEPLKTTNRFWNSLLSRFHLSDTVFTYFEHEEVFNRIIQVNGDDDTLLRYTVERDPRDGDGQLLAIVSNDQLVADAVTVDNLFTNMQAHKQDYHDGVITAHFSPSGRNDIETYIGKDAFKNRFVIDVPIDGWGKPRTALELLRQVCTNGAVAMTPLFRSVVNMGKDPTNTLTRVIESFDNPDGFSKLHRKFETAQKSWASLREMERLKQTINKLPGDYKDLQEKCGKQILEKFGDMGRTYGIVNADSLPVKTQAILPTKATVYDLINMASEIATHHVHGHGDALKFHAFIGTLLAEDYDLQDTLQSAPDFQDFFVKA